MLRALLAAALAGIVAGAHPTAQGQDSAVPAFEVVSIKLRADEPILPGRTAPDRFYRTNTTLVDLINYAFDMREWRIIGGADWVRSEAFEINAKAERVPAPGQMRSMVRRLLEERFALKTHVETRELPMYELVFARGDRRPGPSLQPAKVDCEPFLTGARPREESPTDPDSRMPRCAFGASWSTTTGVLTPQLNGVPIARLVSYIETVVGRRVVDKTALEGRFDITLSYVNQQMLSLPGFATRTGEGPALFTALEEQLGLKLNSARGPVDVLVIDGAERPAFNQENGLVSSPPATPPIRSR
jgi:uncharacterized protein (TIGR03435 family)